MEKQREELLEEIRKFDLKNYRYVMVKPKDGLSWFLLFSLEGGRMRVSPINYAKPAGTTPKQIEDSAQVVHDDVFRNGMEEAYKLTAPLEKFLKDVHKHFGEDLVWQVTILDFILQGMRSLRDGLVQAATF